MAADWSDDGIPDFLRAPKSPTLDYSEDLRRDIAQATEQSAHPSEKAMSETSWTPDDWAVAGISALIAVPLCEAGWHAVVNEPEHFVRGVIAICIGLPLGLGGLSFHRWKTKIPAEARNLIGRAALKWWPVAVFLAFAYFAGPTMYRRLTASSADEIAAAVVRRLPTTTIHSAGGNGRPLQPSPEYLKNISFGRASQSGMPFMFDATSNVTVQRLSLYADVSYLQRGNRWTDKTRGLIGELDNVVKDLPIEQTIVAAAQSNAPDAPKGLFIGDSKRNFPLI